MTEQDKVFQELQTSNLLPQLPQILLKLIQAFDDQDTTIDDLTRLISADPVLTSRLMDIIGSAAVNLPKDINSIESAVVYLGMDTIKNIAISSSALHVFTRTAPVEAFNIIRFWHTSYTCALIAKRLALETGFPQPDEAFLAGLLHGIGRLMMVLHFPDVYSQLITPDIREKDLLEHERETFGITSPEVSAWILRKWKLSSLTADAVLYIHEPLTEITGALALVKILFTAHTLSSESRELSLDDLAALVDVQDTRMEILVQEARMETRGMAETLGIAISLDENDQGWREETLVHEKQLELHLQDLTLFYGTLQSLFQAENRESVLTTVDVGLKLLFGLERIFYFLHDSEKNLLTGFCSPDDKHHKIITSIAVPWTNTTSILTRCLTGKVRMNSFHTSGEEKTAICDTQIIRLLETQGMVVVPMISKGIPIGTIVLGTDAERVSDIEARHSLIDLFAGQIALCIQNITFRNEYTTMLQNERMQAFSTITRKIIHEVNNPIVIITNYLKMLSLKLPDRHPVQSELTVINEEIDRISTLIQGLSGFSKPEIKEFASLDINQLFTSVLEIISKSLLLPKGIKAAIKTDPAIPIIKSDKNGLKQVLINLLKNASEAMNDGGEITISTRFIPESAKIMIDEKKKMPGTIEIIIADNGPGIPDRIKKRLFEPYNSSKTANNSGLGLSIVHSIIKLLNGTITCRSAMGKGTSFTILLPVLSNRKKT